MTLPSKRGNMAASKQSPNGIPKLTAALASPSPVTRKKSREALVILGKPSVPSLIQLLSDRRPHVRWEAAKALCEIADPIAATALVHALDDPNSDVRWLAAEGLAALGQDALQPLLTSLLEEAHPSWLYEGAHHVCHTLVNRKRLGPILRPLLTALKKPEPELAVPMAAYAALSRLRKVCCGHGRSWNKAVPFVSVQGDTGAQEEP